MNNSSKFKNCKIQCRQDNFHKISWISLTPRIDFHKFQKVKNIAKYLTLPRNFFINQILLK